MKRPERRRTARARTVALVATGAALASACGSLGTREPDNVARIIDTVPLGDLPEPPSGAVQPQVPTAASTASATTEPVVAIEAPIGDQAAGRSLLLIGDTSLATLTERQEGGGCEALTGLGWDVEIEAEVARFISFADQVIDELVRPEGSRTWDVVGVQFGRYVDTDPDQFGRDLDDVLDGLGDRPVVLYTIAVGDDGEDDRRPADETDLDEEERAALDQRVLDAQINTEIRLRARTRPNVVLADWAVVVSAGLPVPEPEPAPDAESGDTTIPAPIPGPIPDEPGSDFDYVDDQGVPTADGTARLIALTTEVLGTAPGFVPVVETDATVVTGPDSSSPDATASATGECLPSVFTDDSAIVL